MIMSTSFNRRCRNLVEELGLGRSDEIISISPLAGGVSSDIGVVDMGDRKLCVKFALKQLKVAEEWFANVERNRAEYQWLEFASSIVPSAAPKLLGRSDTAKGFAMEFVENDVYLWKQFLLQGEPDRGEAEGVGNDLGLIHKASADSPVLEDFQNQNDFYALRLEPYLGFTATRHPDLATILHDLIAMLNSNEFVLVHGDVSPKNIMFRLQRPIFLDAECATIGDPSFDLAFCLNHLVLKAVHLEAGRADLLSSVGRFWQSYRPHVQWELPASLEERVCRLLPAMMLARVDGKSPVEYLNEGEQELVRSLAVGLILDPTQTLADFIEAIHKHFKISDYENN